MKTRTTDATVLTSRDLASARTRLAEEFKKEKDPERGAVISRAIMAADAATDAVLDINRYDESKEKQR